MPTPLLTLAEDAVAYVKKQLIYGADNKLTDRARRFRTGQHPALSITEHRNLRDQKMKGVTDMAPDPRQNLASILAEAHDAKVDQIGNCSEQVAVAFAYLMNERRQPGIAYFAIKSNDDSLAFGHAFVLIGLEQEPVGHQYLSDHLPAGWTNAVWCDPWADQCFEIKGNWPDRLYDILEMLEDCEQATRDVVHLKCDAYFDGRNPPGTLV